MAYFRIDYNSGALRRTVSFEMLIPNDPDDDAPAGDRVWNLAAPEIFD